MRDRTKIWLSISTFFVGAGLILFIVVMTINHWDFSSLSTITYKTETHTIEETFQNIELNTEAADVRLERSADGTCRVECSVPEEWKHSVEVSENTLRITLEDDTHWYDHIGINVKSPKITVYLPAKNYKLLAANMTSGKLDVPKYFHFIGIEIETKSGDVECEASATGTLVVTTSSGDVNLNEATATGINVTTSSGRVTAESTTAGSFTVTTASGDIRLREVYCNGDLKIDVTSGDARLSDVSCSNLYSTGESGKLTIDTATVYDTLIIKRQSGDVNLKLCNVGKAIGITTTSGNVTGSFVNPVLTNCNSKSGDIKTPKYSYGVYCEINTGSGDINITDPDIYDPPVTQAVINYPTPSIPLPDGYHTITYAENPSDNRVFIMINQFALYRNKSAQLKVDFMRTVPLSEMQSGQTIGGLAFDSDTPDEEFIVRSHGNSTPDEQFSVFYDLEKVLDASASCDAKKLQVFIEENSGYIITGVYLVYKE